MWEVIGFETQVNDEGKVMSYTLYAVKDFSEGKGSGKRCRRVWYRSSEISYVPLLGDRVLIESELRGKYEAVIDIYTV